jgi:hypothetical protein
MPDGFHGATFSGDARPSALRIIAGLGWVILLTAALPETATAQSSCDTLQSFVRQAPDGFSSFVGGRPPPLSFNEALDRSPANVSWGDADCTVASGNGVLRCSWDHASFADSVKMVTACLAGANKVVAPGQTYFTVPVTHVIVAVSGTDTTDDVLIEIRGGS